MSFSPLTFHPKKKLFKKTFPLILGFYFTMVLHCHFSSFLLFPWCINCKHTFLCTKFSTYSSLIWFWLKIVSFPWIRGIVHNHVLWASRCTSEWRTTSRIIFKFDIDPTPLWWKFWIVKNASSFQSETPSNLVLSSFSKFSYLKDFLESRPHF